MLTALKARRRGHRLAAPRCPRRGLAAACDVQETADLERGRALFSEKCGICHELAEAGSPAGVGPNLDAAFAAARHSGMDQDTIEGVVEAQIENPRTTNEESPYYDQTYMPAKIVTGSDAADVAAYVASVAGIPGIEPPAAALRPAGRLHAALRRLPHALGRRHQRHRRARPRRGAAGPEQGRGRGVDPRPGGRDLVRPVPLRRRDAPVRRDSAARGGPAEARPVPARERRRK